MFFSSYIRIFCLLFYLVKIQKRGEYIIDKPYVPGTGCTGLWLIRKCSPGRSTWSCSAQKRRAFVIRIIRIIETSSSIKHSFSALGADSFMLEKPWINALWMITMVTWQNSQLVSFFKIIQANTTCFKRISLFEFVNRKFLQSGFWQTMAHSTSVKLKTYYLRRHGLFNY